MLIITLFCSCGDMTRYPLKINDQKKYILSCNENYIEIKVTGLMGTRCQLYLKAKKGNFICNTDSLLLVKHPQYEDVNRKSMQFRYNNNDIVGSQVIEEGKILDCYFSFGEYGYDTHRTDKILIAPNNFILCDGKPLITDTIRITFK